MLAPPRKRPRSPSPPSEELTSPLDILLKRRRQHGAFLTDDNDDYPSYFPPQQANEAEGSSTPWNRLVEKRRTKQWDRLNNPSRSASQPNPPALDDYSSPIRPKMYSQPELVRPPMSSSPVRHVPPSSSPFRPGSNANDLQTGQAEDDDDEMDEDELRREWGEEYYNQNSVLRNLHMTRASSYGLTDALSPDSAFHRTPSAGPATSPFPFRTPAAETPYRHPALPPSSPYPGHAQYHGNHLATLTPRHVDEIPSSSPLPELSQTQYSHDSQYTPGGAHHGHDDTMMEGWGDHGQRRTSTDEVGSQYEAANRLLADLAVDRQRRWGV
ncbi:hypothetical protein DB88DRAFT_156383 [Papiliotrema laurentii]|uniref:Uncharacterized protein n=1 Tax=Papiliotrema laurentii TaxID=5418 RepID=A0AAD9FUF8_PAPLA|nr:hypothetical protein DB88DRAFT_156383 [Papiliotrema laurentii]